MQLHTFSLLLSPVSCRIFDIHSSSNQSGALKRVTALLNYAQQMQFSGDIVQKRGNSAQKVETTKHYDWSMIKESLKWPIKCKPLMVQFLRDCVISPFG